MNFQLDEAMAILERTPASLELLLSGLPAGWVHANEGKETWNAEEVIGHLIEAEKSNWIPRIEMVLEKGESLLFPPFDRFAHLEMAPDIDIEKKLMEFKEIRRSNLNKLKIFIDSGKQMELRGCQPEFGSVRLRELISTWVVHDLTHISQIVRVMAGRYREDVGPWQEYLSILNVKSEQGTSRRDPAFPSE